MKNNNLPKLERATAHLEEIHVHSDNWKDGKPEFISGMSKLDFENKLGSGGSIAILPPTSKNYRSRYIGFRIYKDFKGTVTVPEEVYTKIEFNLLEIKQWNCDGKITHDFEDGGIYPLYFGNIKAIIYLGEFLCFSKFVYKEDGLWFTLYKFYKQ